MILDNGAQLVVDRLMVVGTGGSVGGFDGTVDGHVEVRDGGQIDLRDDDFGNFAFNGEVFIRNVGNTVFLDMGADDGNASTQDGDLIFFNGDLNSTANGQLVVTVNALDGFKFGVGETRVIAELNGGVGINPPTFAVTGQHADFAFYGGYLPSNPGEVVIQALNSGAYRRPRHP